jgi:hypothetical protein
MKKRITLAFLVALSFGGSAALAIVLGLPARPHPSTQAWRHTTRQTPSVQPSDLTAVHAAVTQLQKELQQDVTTLRSQVARLNQHQAVSDAALDQLVASLSQTDFEESAVILAGQDMETAPATPEQERENAEARAQAELAVLEETLHTEQADTAWAATAQLALTDTFHAKAIPGAQLLDAHCRTTLCRLEIRLESATAQDQYRELFDVAPWSGESLIHFNAETGAAVMYLARADHALP